MDTTNSQSPAGLTTLLEGARQELIRETTQGSACRAAVECYADRIDTLLQRLFFEAPQARNRSRFWPSEGTAAALTPFSDVDMLVLFEGPLGDERFLRGFLHPLWDFHSWSVTRSASSATLRARGAPTIRSFCSPCSTRGASSATRGLYSRFMTAFRPADTHASVLGLLQPLIDARHARFNDTLYELEPDTKDAPGALRDLLAARTIALLTDPALLGTGPLDPARLDEAEDFLFACGSIVHLERKAQSERPEPRAAGKDGRSFSGICRRRSHSSGLSG